MTHWLWVRHRGVIYFTNISAKTKPRCKTVPALYSGASSRSTHERKKEQIWNLAINSCFILKRACLDDEDDDNDGILDADDPDDDNDGIADQGIVILLLLYKYYTTLILEIIYTQIWCLKFSYHSVAACIWF